MEAAKETVGYTKPTRQKTYITDETCSLIKQKREAKRNNPQEYKRVKPIVQRKLREDKNKAIEQQCVELELASKSGNMGKLFQATRTLTIKFQPRLHCIQSATGDNVTEPAKIADVGANTAKNSTWIERRMCMLSNIPGSPHHCGQKCIKLFTTQLQGRVQVQMRCQLNS